MLIKLFVTRIKYFTSIVYTPKMSSEDERARLVEKIRMAYSLGHGDGLSCGEGIYDYGGDVLDDYGGDVLDDYGGDGSKAGAKKNKYIQYLKYMKAHPKSRKKYVKKSKTTTKSKTATKSKTRKKESW